MVDETHLQKSDKFHEGKYVGTNSDGDLFSGLVVFMIVDFKKSIPIVGRAICETIKIKDKKTELD